VVVHPPNRHDAQDGHPSELSVSTLPTHIHTSLRGVHVRCRTSTSFVDTTRFVDATRRLTAPMPDEPSPVRTPAEPPAPPAPPRVPLSTPPVEEPPQTRDRTPTRRPPPRESRPQL